MYDLCLFVPITWLLCRYPKHRGVLLEIDSEKISCIKIHKTWKHAVQVVLKELLSLQRGVSNQNEEYSGSLLPADDKGLNGAKANTA